LFFFVRKPTLLGSQNNFDDQHRQRSTYQHQEKEIFVAKEENKKYSSLQQACLRIMKLVDYPIA